MMKASGVRLTWLDASRVGEFAEESLRRAEVLANAGRTLVDRTLLRLRVGDEADRAVPERGRIKLIKILYQPETAGDFAS